MTDDPQIVTGERWLEARRELLAREKELSRRHDAISAARRALPMVEITEDYRFEGPAGQVGLIDLFDGRSQLLVYHFMLGPEAEAGCPACSFTMDYVGPLEHLHARDTSFAAVSRGDFATLHRYRERMGWTFPWYSSLGSTFNYDFHVTLDAAVAPVTYNYKDQAELERADPAWRDWSGEEHGVSAFLRRGDRVFHTYSAYARATEILMGAYNWLDLTARGRQEHWEPEPRRGDDPSMSWLRRRDEYTSISDRD